MNQDCLGYTRLYVWFMEFDKGGSFKGKKRGGGKPEKQDSCLISD